MTELKLDEGVCYFTLLPSENNPFTSQIKGFRENHEWFGVIHPGGYAIVPFKISFRSLIPKTKEQIDLFPKLLALKIRRLMVSSVGYVFETLPQKRFVEDWLTVVEGTAVTVVDKNSIAKVKMGGVVETILNVVMSEFIACIPALQEKYGYSITLDKVEPTAILLGTFVDEERISRFKQILYDENISVSSYKWDVGLSFRRNFLWKTPWYKFLEELV